MLRAQYDVLSCVAGLVPQIQCMALKVALHMSMQNHLLIYWHTGCPETAVQGVFLRAASEFARGRQDA